MNDLSAIDRHERVMLQFSGGRDSLATLELCKPWWDKIFVVYCNPGDEFPETTEVINAVKKLPINFIEAAPEVKQPESIEEYGLPSDLIPLRNTYDYSWLTGMKMTGVAIQHSMSCCGRLLFEPLQEAVKKLDVTLIIRGQRLSELMVSPVRSGDVIDGIEYLMPLEDYKESDVFRFLKDSRITIPEYYEFLDHSPDCMTCTAFLGQSKDKVTYLRSFHPATYEIVAERLKTIKASIDAEYQHLIDAVKI